MQYLVKTKSIEDETTKVLASKDMYPDLKLNMNSRYIRIVCFET